MISVGITPSVRENGAITIGSDYTDAVMRAGMLPVLLPLTDDETMLEKMLAAADALLFSGGGDIDPALYGETRISETQGIHALRDRMEISLMRRAVRAKMPVLAICRGIQVAAVAFGGALYQDIGKQYKKEIVHPRNDVPREVVHGAAIAEGSLLRRIVGEKEILINSRHHQAIKGCPDGFFVSAVAPDGVIEAIERHDMPFCLAVQWHPESLADRYDAHHRLFVALKSACGGGIA